MSDESDLGEFEACFRQGGMGVFVAFVFCTWLACRCAA